MEHEPSMLICQAFLGVLYQKMLVHPSCGAATARQNQMPTSSNGIVIGASYSLLQRLNITFVTTLVH